MVCMLQRLIMSAVEDEIRRYVCSLTSQECLAFAEQVAAGTSSIRIEDVPLDAVQGMWSLVQWSLHLRGCVVVVDNDRIARGIQHSWKVPAYKAPPRSHDRHIGVDATSRRDDDHRVYAHGTSTTTQTLHEVLNTPPEQGHVWFPMSWHPICTMAYIARHARSIHSAHLLHYQLVNDAGMKLHSGEEKAVRSLDLISAKEMITRFTAVGTYRVIENATHPTTLEFVSRGNTTLANAINVQIRRLNTTFHGHAEYRPLHPTTVSLSKAANNPNNRVIQVLKQLAGKVVTLELALKVNRKTSVSGFNTVYLKLVSVITPLQLPCHAQVAHWYSEGVAFGTSRS